MKQYYGILLLLAGLCFGMYQCTYDNAEQPDPAFSSNDEVCDTLQPSFADDIQPIFQNHCAVSGCHDQFTQEDGKVWETYTQISEGVENGKVLCSIKKEDDCVNMPPAEYDQLTSLQIQMIECWNEQGVPNN